MEWDVGNYVGQTPLHVAAQFNSKEMGELLISKGADVNQKTVNDREEKEPTNIPDLAKSHYKTPLHFAAKYNSKEMVELLISKGADINVKDYIDIVN